jgi:hypothetical protein
MNDVEFTEHLKTQMTHSFLAGGVNWSKDQLSIATAGGPRIDSPEVTEKLLGWERQGFIRIRNTSSIYFEILRPFPDVLQLTNEKVAILLDVAAAGIDKSWSEGLYEWSREGFNGLLHHRINPEDSRVLAALREWEKAGVIHFVGREDVYFKVLKPFP